MLREAQDVPWSWDVTSDSLSAWLAGTIGAERVLLVKHVEPPAGPLRAADLVAEGIIDPAFPGFLRASGARAFIAGPTGHRTAAIAMRSGGAAGAAIELD
jgi:dihydroneopterin aldolase